MEIAERAETEKKQRKINELKTQLGASCNVEQQETLVKSAKPNSEPNVTPSETQANDELGRVLGFGWARDGRLGPEINGNQRKPIKSDGLGAVRSVNANYNTMTIDDEGVMSFNGAKVAMPVKVKYVTSGYETQFAIDENDRLYSWGNPGRYNFGQLGHGDLNERDTPTMIARLSDVRVKQITVCSTQIACTTFDSRAFVWGDCGSSFGMNREVHTPTEMTEWGRVAHVERGERFALVLDLEGHLFGYGANRSGQLGFGDTTTRSKLTKIDAFDNKEIIKFECGVFSAVVLTTSGLFVMGSSVVGGRDNVPTLIDLSNVIDVSLSLSHILALTEDKSVFAWGDNSSGQCGVGSEERQIFPPRRVMVDAEYEVKQVSAGVSHSLIKYTMKN